MENIKNVCVIGAGTMGNGIAHVFAMAGFNVFLADKSKNALEKAATTIEKNLDRMVQKGLINDEKKTETISNIKTENSVFAAVKTADLIVEAATENINIKENIFLEIDENSPKHCILASNTSSISITRLASVTKRPEKVIGMHFMNPVPVMKLVEVICGYSTSQETSENILALCKKLGKIPVKVQDYPGFAANRILMPMINEAVYTLESGIAGVKEIDAVMKLGMAHPMGPLQLADFIGLDVCLDIMNLMYSELKNPKYAPCPLLSMMVAAGKLGVKSGEGFYDYSENTKAEKVASKFL